MKAIRTDVIGIEGKVHLKASSHSYQQRGCVEFLVTFVVLHDGDNFVSVREFLKQAACDGRLLQLTLKKLEGP